jgi:hypothetical protein
MIVKKPLKLPKKTLNGTLPFILQPSHNVEKFVIFTTCLNLQLYEMYIFEFLSAFYVCPKNFHSYVLSKEEYGVNSILLKARPNWA